MTDPKEPAPVDPPTTMHVRRAADGDAESLTWLITRFSPLLIAQARYRLGTSLQTLYDPEDIVNDAWAIALPRLPALPTRDGRLTPTFLKFLASTVINRINTLLQKHILGKSRVIGSEGDEDESPLSRLAADTLNVVSRAVQRELHGEVLRHLEKLDDQDRAILLMRAVEQSAVREVADELGMLPNTVAVRYRRALEKARQLMPESVFDELVHA